MRVSGGDWPKLERTTIGIGRPPSEVPLSALRVPSLGITGEYKAEEGHGEVYERVVAED